MKHGTPLADPGPSRDLGKEQFWQTTLTRFAQAGQTVHVFCRQRRLAEATFYTWRRRFARQAPAPAAPPTVAAAPPPAPAPGAAFVPIRLAAAPAGWIEIVLAGGAGRRLRLRGPVDRADLAAVLGVLEGPAC
jgi:hypothetical protein